MTVAAIPQPQEQSIAVGLGEVAVQHVDADQPLVAHGLGSCIALCLYDPITRLAGLAHVVLPGNDPQNAPNAKFAGSALPALLQAMAAKVGGAVDPKRMQARLAGGAHVLAGGSSGSLARIGEKNAEAVTAALAAASVQVIAADVGGGKGRTVWFHPRDGGRIRVRTVGGPEVEL